ncbi:MAG TPA: class I SAM-dependent methyltransferase [Burkholderiales bacterium]|nr:class I SAM-dependent methyltransferase [Burkholderiales bacterium]
MYFTRRAASITVAALLASALGLSGAFAADKPAAKGEFTPQVGQEGKDVIWVPTPQSLVERMLQMAGTKPTDYVVDLGSGDGRTVITAAKKFGARALGVEYNPDMVALAKRAAEKEGVADKAQFVQGDIFQTDFTKANVLTLYLLPSLNLKLRPIILDKMRPGTRVVSHAFTMDDWQADQVDSSEGRTAYMWIVPAKVAGNWTIDVAGGGARSYEASFTQKFQMIEGNARSTGKLSPVSNGKLRGEQITFTIEDGGKREFTGRVIGDRMEGTAKGAGGDAKWTARRTEGK